MKARTKKVVKITLVTVILLVAAGLVLFETQTTGHSTPTRPPQPVPESGDAVLDSIRRGIEFLKVHQEDDHEFSKGLLDPKPAVTALVLDTIVKSPDGYSYEEHQFVRDACAAILSHQQDDGGIYTPAFGLGNYCTSISVMALETTGAERFAPQIERAIAFIRKCQSGEEAGDQAGGFGYGGVGRADLSNTLQSLEAMRQAGLDADDEAFARAAAFISRCQNSSETNPETWAGDDGGFLYRPASDKAGTVTRSDGSVGYKSYGLMSYAGLMSLLHAHVDRTDPRVQSAIRWIENNYTFDENVNLGDDGLYYYYMVMAKALAAYGERTLVDEEGVQHDWAKEMADELMRLQAPDGSWRNPKSDRWMEGDSVLVTAYVVRALTICWQTMQTPAPGEPVDSDGSPPK